MPSPGKEMSKILPRFDEATNLFDGGLNDLDRVVVGYDRTIAHNGGVVAVVIDDAFLRGRPLCEGHKV